MERISFDDNGLMGSVVFGTMADRRHFGNASI